MLTKCRGIISQGGPASLAAIALLVGVILFLGNPELVHACKCAVPGTPSEELENSSAVFVGRVVSIHHSFDPNASSVTPDDRTTVEFEVSAVWKGTVHEGMYITTPPPLGSCGFTFVAGEEYIVYGHDGKYGEGGYTVSICSRTALIGQAQADIDELGEGQAPLAGIGGQPSEQPQHTVLPGTGGYWPSVWAVVLIVGIGAASATLGLLVLRRRPLC